MTDRNANLSLRQTRWERPSEHMVRRRRKASSDWHSRQYKHTAQVDIILIRTATMLVFPPPNLRALVLPQHSLSHNLLGRSPVHRCIDILSRSQRRASRKKNRVQIKPRKNQVKKRVHSTLHSSTLFTHIVHFQCCCTQAAPITTSWVNKRRIPWSL